MNLLYTEQLKEVASFRDKDGFVFYDSGQVYRYIFPRYFSKYKHLITSGLYKNLLQKNYLLPFEPITSNDENIILKTKKIPFISYPYEWSFTQLKEAAKLTLEIQKIALEHGMQLKDASSYNIQFIGSKPIFIDLLSFDFCRKDFVWNAYKQFCNHFLAPLAICAFSDPRLKSLYISNIDGLSLDLAKEILPWKTYLSPSRFLHLWIHNYFQKKKSFTHQNLRKKCTEDSKSAAFRLIDSLYGSIKSLRIKKSNTAWGRYEKGHSYNPIAFQSKESIISKLLEEIRPDIIWDLGCNQGHFTKIASKYSQYSIGFDSDLFCIDAMYNNLKNEDNKNILPLHMDISNPWPNIGWDNSERKGIIERGPCDLTIALALVHHLLVTCNIPLEKVVDFLAKISIQLIIEFIPYSDSKFQQIIQSNPNDFSFLSEEFFISNFSKAFILKRRIPIENSTRVIHSYVRR